VLVDQQKIRIGNKLYFGDDDSLVVLKLLIILLLVDEHCVFFTMDRMKFRNKLTELGETPIPKYISRDVTPEDAERYQTIYMQEGCSCANSRITLFKAFIKKIRN
jgi:S-adenosylmethionine:tRNA ribosyltransferase-isomerase